MSAPPKRIPSDSLPVTGNGIVVPTHPKDVITAANGSWDYLVLAIQSLHSPHKFHVEDISLTSSNNSLH